MIIIQNSDPNIKIGFEETTNNNNVNENSITNNNDIKILEESRDYNTGGNIKKKEEKEIIKIIIYIKFF